MLWPNIIQFGRITSDVIRDISVRGLNSTSIPLSNRWIKLWACGKGKGRGKEHSVQNSLQLTPLAPAL